MSDTGKTVNLVEPPATPPLEIPAVEIKVVPGKAASALSPRNVAVDAYRGLVMLLMMGEVVHFAHVALSFPHSLFWRILGFNQSHVEWAGMSLHDTIQPSFTFLVGVALPYSLRARRRKGQSFQRLLAHTILRSFILIALGIFLRSTHSSMSNFTFEDTLTQIGLGYTFAFLLTYVRPRWQWTAFGCILFGYWLAWALYPAPGPNFNWGAVGVPPDWYSHIYHGFAAHWNKNSNLGQAFDVWFLNLFPRPTPFRFNDGGYLTLSFIPTLGTMLLGLAAGRWYIESSPKIPFRKFLIAAALLIGSALVLHFTGICPIVKRIWTPAWTLFSGGVCFLFLTAFSWFVDAKKHTRPVFFLIIIGMNSIAAYLLADLFGGMVTSNIRINVGASALNMFGSVFEPIVLGSLTLAVYWLILFWMYRNKVFIRI